MQPMLSVQQDPCFSLTRTECGAADGDGTSGWQNSGISASRPGGFSTKKRKERKKEIPVFPAKLLFFCNQYFFIYIIFQRGEIICHLAELLTDRKEEILAANKTDMDQAVNAGRITRKSRNVCLRL